jgi:hypothetical protein
VWGCHGCGQNKKGKKRTPELALGISFPKPISKDPRNEEHIFIKGKNEQKEAIMNKGAKIPIIQNARIVE